MVDFPSAVAVPPTSAYAPPNMAQWLSSFLSDSIGNLSNDYYQGKQNRFQDQQNQRTLNLQQPINSTDPNVVYKELLQRGGAPYAEALMPFIIDQQLRQQAGQPDPFLSPGGGLQTNNAAPAAAPALARPAGATPATYAGGDSGVGTITDIVTAKLPQNSTQTGQDIAKIAQTMGIDPNAPLTPGQQRRVQGLLDRYTQNSPAPAPAAAAPAQPGSPPAVGTPNAKVADAFAALPPSAGAVLPAPQRTQAPAPNAAASAAPVATAAAPAQSAPLVPQPPMPRGGAGTGSIVDIVSAAYPENSVETNRLISRIASTMETEPNAPLSSGQQVRAKGLLSRYSTGADSSVSATAASAPAASDQPAQPPAQPLKPQYRLPQNPATGKQFTPQEAVIAIDDQISKLSGNKFAADRIKALEDMRERYAAMIDPINVSSGTTILDPRTSARLYQGPAAAAYATPEAEDTLNADGERYRQTGTFPPGMGRGIQGQQQATRIRNRAVEQEINAGGDPNQWPQRWQEFKAKGVGLSAEARVGATREANLKIILRAADAAVPAAIEQSEKVWRSGFVPLNKIIQRGQLMTSDPELGAFGMANLQLAEHWARAINPTGVMRESDRDKALEFLSTATSQATYKRLVQQLQKQIQRELTAVQAGKPSGSIPEPGVLSAEQKDASPNKARASPPADVPRISTKADYDALPSGAPFIDPDGKPWQKP